MPDYTTSRKYEDAKTLWISKPRVYNHELPRVTAWSLSIGIDANDRAELLATDFYDVFVQNKLMETANFIGTDSLATYLRDHPSIKVYVRTTRNWAALLGSTYQPVDCYDSSAGTHFNQPCLSATRHSQNLCYQSDAGERYVFLESDGTPRSVKLIMIDDVPHESIGVPVLPETLQFWTDCERYMWNLQTISGGMLFGQHILNVMNSYEITPTGLLMDWEDVYAAYVAALKTEYDEDPRFNQHHLNYHPSRLIQKYYGDLTTARMEVLDELAPWAVPEYTNLYDSGSQDRFRHWTRLEKAYGRNKTSISLYDHYQISAGPLDLLYKHGREMAWKHEYDCHVYNLWYTPGLTLDIADSKKDPPVEKAMDTISFTVALCKAAMATGAYTLSFYVDNNAACHPYYSMLVAFDEMQQYHSFIKYGVNYIPPSGVYRPSKTSPVESNPNPQTIVPTIWYGKDYAGNVLNENIWVCCRVYNGRYLFYAMTLDGTVTVGVKAPTGQAVSVTADPMGTVKVI